MSLTPAAISKLKVAELKEQLEERGLDTSGKKEELVQRLTQAVEAEEDGGKDEQEPEAQAAEDAPASATENKHAPPSPVKHVAAEDSAEAGEIPAEEEAPKSKFAPIQWVAPVPAAKAAAPETNGKAAEAEAAVSDGEASGGADKPVSEMTEVEKILARAKKYGTPVDEKLLAAAKLAERAKRFNIEPVAATKEAGKTSQPKGGAGKSAVDVEALKKRAERFQTSNPTVAKTLASAEEEEKRRKRLEKFGPQEAVTDTSFNKHKKRKF